MAPLKYRISAPEPHSHLVHVTVEAADVPGPYADFVMPAWSPGSYKIRDFARHVQDVEASGRVEKIDKSRWRVHGRSRVTLRYKAYAFELSVRSSHLDADHAHLIGPSIFMYLDGAKDRPCELTIDPPRGWKIATGMEPAGKNRFAAPDYDTFIDCPIELGTFGLRTFRVRGKEHRFVFHAAGNFDPSRIVRDTAKIVEQAARMMGGLPYRHYTFFLHTTPEGGGGLEHLNSTSLQTKPYEFRPRERYINFLRLVAHEFFHLWNVKRTHPEALGPFDYEHEVYTTDLWIMEGLTSYFENLLVRRAGLMSADKFVKILGDEIHKYRETPGRRVQPLSQASFDSWIKFYQQDENSANTAISYYDKGELVGTLLDLEIRRRTRNRRSLDDVMRVLYDAYGRHGRGYPPGAFQAAASRVAGANLAPFFRAYVDGLKELPFERALATAGLRLEPEKAKKDEEKKKAHLGLTPRRQGERLFVATVLAGSPAYAGGINARDEILAVDGLRVDADQWERQLEARRPGDRARILVARLGRLKTLSVTFGGRPAKPPKVARFKKPTRAQRDVYSKWLKSPWPR